MKTILDFKRFVRSWGGEPIGRIAVIRLIDEYLSLEPPADIVLQQSLVDLRALWIERAKRLRKDPSYTDCAVTLESCADELSSLFKFD